MSVYFEKWKEDNTDGERKSGDNKTKDVCIHIYFKLIYRTCNDDAPSKRLSNKTLSRRHRKHSFRLLVKRLLKQDQLFSLYLIASQNLKVISYC